MAKRDIERELEAIAALRTVGATPETVGHLRKALRDRINLVSAKAAAVAAHLHLRVLLPDLLSAYDGLFHDPVKRDPQCAAKTALAKALKDLEVTDSHPFLRGAVHRQWEPVYKGEADSAGALRGNCLLALPFCTDLVREDKLWHLMRGLTDGLTSVRIEAARALEQMEGIEAALLLRLKSRMPESDWSVTGQVFESLLAIEHDAGVPFVFEFYSQHGENDRNEDLAEQAALALGASRLPLAVATLINASKQQQPPAELLLRALSASRADTALEFLIALIADGREREATAALDALLLHRDSPEIVDRIRNAVAIRENEHVSQAFLRLFPAS